jgi:hypothetical protein
MAAVGILITLMAGFPAAAEAQTTGLLVNIPFEFQVGDQLLPPGSYTVSLRSGSTLTITDGKGLTAIRLTNAEKRRDPGMSEQSRLVFTLYENRYFLKEIRWAGYKDVRSLVKSKAEIELAKLNSPFTKTVVAAK